MKLNKLLILILITILPFIVIKPAFAGFGVSPSEIYNDSLKPGAKFEKEIVLSRSDAEENLNVVIETDLNEAESWVTFDKGKEFIFPKGENRKTIKAIVSIPKNADLKNYKGFIRIKASSADSSSSGVSIVQGARMEVNLITTSINVDLLDIKGFNIPNVDFQKPIKLLVNIQNNGNTEIAPSKIILEIQNLNKNFITTVETTKLEKIEPNTTKEITAEFENKLNGGEYFAIVKAYLDDKLLRSDRLVFKIGAPPEGYNPVTAQKANFFSKVISFIKTNKTEIILFFLILLIPIVIGYILFKKSKSKKVKTVFLIATVGYAIITFTLLYLYHQHYLNNLAKPDDNGNVEGETIEIRPTDISKVNSDASGVTVKKKESTYPIYRTANLNSEVVYTASEGENLSVLEEQDGWYRVSTGKGTGGWLPKTSVKKTQ